MTSQKSFWQVLSWEERGGGSEADRETWGHSRGSRGQGWWARPSQSPPAWHASTATHIAKVAARVHRIHSLRQATLTSGRRGDGHAAAAPPGTCPALCSAGARPARGTPDGRGTDTSSSTPAPTCSVTARVHLPLCGQAADRVTPMQGLSRPRGWREWGAQGGSDEPRGRDCRPPWSGTQRVRDAHYR